MKYFKIKMFKNWEDLGKLFKKGKIYVVKELEIESEFFIDGYYLIPKSFCKIIRDK